jgi:hypothetical protein
MTFGCDAGFHREILELWAHGGYLIVMIVEDYDAPVSMTLNGCSASGAFIGEMCQDRSAIVSLNPNVVSGFFWSLQIKSPVVAMMRGDCCLMAGIAKAP